MASPLLSTKLFPPSPAQHLPRRRLLARLGGFRGGTVALVSAPAGFGKTTLVGAWLATLEEPAAWLSLDAHDGAPARFARYLLAALRRADAALVPEADALLEEAPDTALVPLVTLLVNALADPARERGLVLVLDDYHLVEGAPAHSAVHNAVQLLAERLPPGLQLVLTSRTEPPLALPRLRVRGRLLEIGPDELRFTREEAARFFAEVMRLELSAAQLSLLAERTEGWAAALQMAAISLRGVDDAAAFLERFGGSHRLLAGYLADEVLTQLPAAEHDFLLHTSILERFCAPLCDAVRDAGDSAELLERLERGNVFLVPLDHERCWYRYHHLFGELLRARLAREAAEGGVDEAALHRRASAWYDAHGMPFEAVEHALAADDFEQAARLIDGIDIMREYTHSDPDRIIGWLARLPREVRAERPLWSIGLAAYELPRHDPAVLNEHLADAERALARNDAAGGAWLDPAEAALVEAMISSVRTSERLNSGDPRGCLRAAARTRELVPAHVKLGRIAPEVHAGFALACLGDVDAGQRALEAGYREAKAQRVYEMVAVAVNFLREIYLARGELDALEDLCDDAAATLEREGAGHFPAAPLVDFARLVLCYERNELDRLEAALAARVARPAVDGSPTGRATLPFLRARLALARGRRGELPALLAELRDAAEAASQSRFPGLLAAQHALVLLRTGDLAGAVRWADEAESDVVADPAGARDLPRAAERFALARVRTAEGRFDAAEEVLAGEMSYAETKGLHGDALEARLLLALNEFRRDRLEPALTLLEAALTRAARQRRVRLFLDEGAPMRELLRHALRRGVAAVHAQQLEAAFEGTAGGVAKGATRGTAGGVGGAAGNDPTAAEPGVAIAGFSRELVEPLSSREREVLALIAAGLSNKQIARRLAIATTTVKRHAANIYGKLGVGSRTQAVARASELDLL